MPQQQSPWLEGAYGWNFGEGGWNTGMDANLLKFSFMFDKNVDSIVSSLPPAVNGQAHYLTTDNRLYFAVGTTYYSTPTPKWFVITLKSSGQTYQFDGTNLVQTDTPAQTDSRLDAVELTVSSLGSAAFEDVSAFATQAGLDVLEGQSQAYTDTLRTDLDNMEDPLKGAGMVGYKGRTQAQRNSDVLSVRDYITTTIDGTTSNQAGIVAAVAAAASAGASLYWPSGTYVSDANIPNFHGVRHIGDGVVKRGTDTFKVAQRAGQTNTIYCGASGSASNDGLTAALPIDTLQNALNVLPNYGPMLPGTWIVSLDAGTYGGGVTFPDNLGSEVRVQILGPSVGASPAVPTAIIDGGSVQSFGLNFSDSAKVLLRDVKFTNFLDYGVVAQDLCDIYLINVHGDSITGGRGIGFLGQQGRYRVYGGKFNNCGTYGLEFISDSTVSVGSLTNDLAGGVSISNCGTAGVLVQEGSTGHLDYLTIDTAPYGFDLVVNSRINSTSCAFNNISSTGVRRRLGSWWLNFNNTCTWTNVANKERAYAYSGDTNRSAAAVSAIRTTIDTTQFTHTGTTAETTLKTYPAALLADSFDWNGRSQRVVITGQFTGTAGTKTLRVKIGANLIHGLVSVASSTGFFKYEGILHATGPSSQAYSAFMLDSSASVVKGDSGTRAYSMVTGADQTVTITGQLSQAAESIIIHAVEIWETA